MQHRNAPLTPLGRRRLVALVEEDGLMVKRAKRLVSICSRSPGQGHSKRRASSFGSAGRRERPRRARQRETVAWGTPVSKAIRP